MAEDIPATDVGTPTPHHRPRRNPARRKETTPPASAAPAKKTKTDIAIAEAAARLAAEAPPLSEGQKRRIAELLAPAVSAVVKR